MLKAWEAMRVIAPDTCRPFSKDRRGMILGEGGAMMILEPFDAAQARGARIYAEICGMGMTSDAHHLTQPTVDGPARAMRGALREARMAPEEVGYINAHGTGTAGNDPVETKAIREVFGAHADKLAVSSTKSMHGHALGAAGALEAIATVLALHHGILPPTANFTEPDPECDLDYIPNQARAAPGGSGAFEFLRFRRTQRRRRLPRIQVVRKIIATTSQATLFASRNSSHIRARHAVPGKRALRASANSRERPDVTLCTWRAPANAGPGMACPYKARVLECL